MDVGKELLLSYGIRVTVDAVVARAGIAKTTFYTYFRDKETFIEMVLLRESARTISEEDLLQAETGDLAATLLAFGIRYLRFANEQRLMGWDRLIASAYDIYPELALRLYDAGPGRGYSLLTQILSHAADEGILKIDDPAAAAEDLTALWYGNRVLRINLRVAPAMTEQEIESRARRGVDMLFRLYS